MLSSFFTRKYISNEFRKNINQLEDKRNAEVRGTGMIGGRGKST